MANTAKEQSYFVVKSNELIRKSRFTMATQQYKLLLYLISKIKPNDYPNMTYTFNVGDFCRVCNIDEGNGQNYIDIKQSIKDLADRSVWYSMPDGAEVLLRWINTVHIYPNSGSIDIKFHEDMFPFLLGLREHYTQYRLENVLPMRSKYGLRLYELLKSFEGVKEYYATTLEDLKKRMDCDGVYKRFPDFKRFALEKAIEDINTFSDLNVSYHLSKQKGSRAFTDIMFHILPATDIVGHIHAMNRFAALTPREKP